MVLADKSPVLLPCTLQCIMQAGINTLMIYGSEEILYKMTSEIPFCYAGPCIIFIFTSKLMEIHLCVHRVAMCTEKLYM